MPPLPTAPQGSPQGGSSQGGSSQGNGSQGSPRTGLAPALRKALGSMAILAWLLAWIGGAAALGERIAGAPWPVLALFYAVAGVAWVIPLRPLFRWMNG